jgi:hypothetical protein
MIPIATANSAHIEPPNRTPCVQERFNCPERKAAKKVLIALLLAAAFTILAIAIYAVKGLRHFCGKRR